MAIKNLEAFGKLNSLVLFLLLIFVFSVFLIPSVFSATLYIQIKEPTAYTTVVASASTTIVNDPVANCPGTPGTTVSVTCTDYTYGSSCCQKEGNYKVWAYSSESQNAPNSGSFVEYTVNWDANSNYCTCKVGSGRWNIGGEVAGTTCCGDDSGEYDLVCIGDAGACSGASDNKACCNAVADCVYNNACYNNGATRGSYQCDNGYWRLVGGYCGVSIDGNVWNVTTQTGTKILSIDDDGDAVFFCDNMYQSTSPPGGLTNSLLIQVSGTLYYALNTNNCYIKGSIIDETTVPSEDGNDLVVKASGTPVANFNSNSNIYLSGVAAYDGAQANCAAGYTCDGTTMKCI